MVYPDLTPCIDQEAHGARHCIAMLQSTQKHMVDVFETISTLFKEHSKRLTRQWNNDPHLEKYPLIKEQLIDLISIGQFYAEFFDDIRKQIKHALVAISPSPKCILEEEMEQAHKQVEINDKELAKLKKKQNKCHEKLNQNYNQLNDPLLKQKKRNELEAKREACEENSQERQIRIQGAQAACQNAKMKYEEEATHLFHRSQQRELEELQKLITYIQSYIKAVQIPSSENQIKQIQDEMITKHDLEQDLQSWRTTFMSINLADKRIAHLKQRDRSYIVEEPSSDDDDDDDDEADNSTAVVVYKPSSKQRR